MEQNPSLPSDPHPYDQTDGRRHSRGTGFIAGLVFGILGAGVLGFAIGATMPAAEAAIGAAMHGGFGHHGPPTPEEAKEKAEFFVGFALHRLGATPEQEARVQGIINGAIDELFPAIQEHRANREELRALFTGATIDRAAIERIRTEEMALAETASRAITEALADSVEILTPEQRTKLAERLARFHRHH